MTNIKLNLIANNSDYSPAYAYALAA